MKKLSILIFLMFSIVLLFIACDQLGDRSHDGVKPLDDKSQSEVNATKDKFSSRLQWQRPDFVIESLGDLSDKVVADIGAESGYFTFRLAKRANKVIAIEIDPNMIELIELFKENINIDFQSKIETRQALPSDPKLNNGEVDVALIINTIGYIEDKVAYLKKVKEGLSDEGVLLIVDFKNKELPAEVAVNVDIITDDNILQDQLETVGFELVRINNNALPFQYMIWAFK